MVSFLHCHTSSGDEWCEDMLHHCVLCGADCVLSWVDRSWWRFMEQTSVFSSWEQDGVLLSGLAGIKNFNVHEDHTTIAQRWVKQFELYVIASGVSDVEQKCPLFLHLTGPDIQDIYDTLPASGDTSWLSLKLTDIFNQLKTLLGNDSSFIELFLIPRKLCMNM